MGDEALRASALLESDPGTPGLPWHGAPGQTRTPSSNAASWTAASMSAEVRLPYPGRPGEPGPGASRPDRWQPGSVVGAWRSETASQL